MSSHQELLVGLELPSQVGCVLGTGGRGGGMAGEGGTQAGGNQGLSLTGVSLSCIATIIDHVIEQKFLFCKSGIGAWTYITLLKTVAGRLQSRLAMTA